MTIEEIKAAYQELAKEVFSGPKKGASARLEKVVKRIVKAYTEDENTRMIPTYAETESHVVCNTYVTSPTS